MIEDEGQCVRNGIELDSGSDDCIVGLFQFHPCQWR